ncbi:MAG: MarR family transcriptional regulator [Ligilactobacillus animalis]|uniref:MarR family transcriptional regulator n=1 Tax=Ligilactobacillus animalis TaxID=1605 RepID=UPI003821BD6A
MQLTHEQLLGLRRIKGERNITITELAEEMEISRFALSRALKNQGIRPANVKIINDWLLKQYIK